MLHAHIVKIPLAEIKSIHLASFYSSSLCVYSTQQLYPPHCLCYQFLIIPLDSSFFSSRPTQPFPTFQSLFNLKYMHTVSHSLTGLTHRGPGASRARPRWQPYSAISSHPSRSPANPIFPNTPSSVASSPPSTFHITPTNNFDVPRKPSIHVQRPAQLAQIREAQKNLYVSRLVGWYLT